VLDGILPKDTTAWQEPLGLCDVIVGVVIGLKAAAELQACQLGQARQLLYHLCNETHVFEPEQA
jgi:hypothetical protein